MNIMETQSQLHLSLAVKLPKVWQHLMAGSFNLTFHLSPSASPVLYKDLELLEAEGASLFHVHAAPGIGGSLCRTGVQNNVQNNESAVK